MFKFGVYSAFMGMAVMSFGNATVAAEGANPATATLAENEAFVLVKVAARGSLRQYVSSINFGDTNGSYRLKVPEAEELQLVKVKAGVYKPSDFGVVSAKAPEKSLAFDDSKRDEKAIVIEPGTVSYIGKWDVAYGQSFVWQGKRFTNDQSAYRVSYSIDEVKDFAKENSWVTQYPIRFAHISGKNVNASWQELQDWQVN